MIRMTVISKDETEQRHGYIRAEAIEMVMPGLHNTEVFIGDGFVNVAESVDAIVERIAAEEKANG